MSAAPAPTGTASGAGKKAVHVKWAGKTIALGTFLSAEADEKCARAKALTRAWRSTMRPKPSRDWVMLELERLGVRVVSGRLGRKAGEEDEGERKTGDAMGRAGPPQAPRNNSMGWASNADLDNLMQRRSSSIGLSMMNEKDLGPRRGSMNSLGPALGLDSNDPPHRPLVGGGAAAAYEAKRADHYAQKREEQQRRASTLGLGMGGGSAGMQMGLSVNPNQHYEMLKLHHMNLLNEIQETTLMMNLYQQQQLQQQQQHLQQQQASAEGADQIAMMQQLSGAGGSMDPLYGSQRGSLGLGSNGDSQLQMMRQHQVPAPAPKPAKPAKSVKPSKPAPKEEPASKKSEPPSKGNAALLDELLKGQREQQALEERLKKLKDDIARREKEARELEEQAKVAAAGTEGKPSPKRSSQASDKDEEKDEKKEEKVEEPDAKKAKVENRKDQEKDQEKPKGGKKEEAKKEE